MIAVAISIGWSGCRLHDVDEGRLPSVDAASAFVERVDNAAPNPNDPTASDPPRSDLDPSEPWWSRLGDGVLDRRIREALVANLDLRAIAARVAEAEAFVRRIRAGRRPTLDGAGDVEATRSSDGASSQLTSVGLHLAWELDLWGRVASARDAALRDVAAAEDDLAAARLALSARVAEWHFALRAERAQLALLEEQTQVGETLLELTQLRFGQGQSSIVDVLQQREQLAATRSLEPEVQRRVARFEHALDVISGRAPDGPSDDPVTELPEPPAVADLGLPGDLLDRRPDLRAARRRVEALDFRVGEAIADRLPRITIGGSLEGVGTPRIDALVGSLFASVVGPLIDGGARRAEVAARRARLEESVALYSQAFLVAVREVEDALSDERAHAGLVERLSAELVIAQSLLDESRHRYRQGLTDYLPVLSAVVTVQNLERRLIASRRDRVIARVLLHRALGGSLGDAPSVALARGEGGS